MASTQVLRKSNSKLLETKKQTKLDKENDKKNRVLTPALIYQEAKYLFSRSSLPRFIGREKEKEFIINFWKKYICGDQTSSLYISGCPGTGKSALISHITMKMVEEEHPKISHKIHVTNINCMSLKNPKMIYKKLLEDFSPRNQSTEESEIISALDSLFVPQKIRKDTPKYVCILDEIDYLNTRDQEVLYKLFEWPIKSNSRLSIIGIANALNMTDRFLPRLKAKNCEPQYLNFNPYEMKDMINIIKDRLDILNKKVINNENNENCENNNNIIVIDEEKTKTKPQDYLIQASAIELCSRKIAGTGDLRKALDVCKQAIEFAEADLRNKTILLKRKPTQPVKENSIFLKKAATYDTPITSISEVPQVTIMHILKATNNAFGSASVQKLKGLNVQQKVILNAEYINSCRKYRMISPVSKSEFNDLVSMLESCGIITLGKARDERNRKFTLHVQENEIRKAVSDLPFLLQMLN
ncbi:P-loop containing nucleoside triphosphate hydrolase protein [Neocallimastix californiae]|uniref:Cell division control protein n=1 Tax=Neocallimastix californiae TaxID=1754190 RepID=A0A1Y2AG02_9FUNG|nr:P-loop containing nucleoside triphosphate hydrolase protein [Neocallimastix californiae]|eukprot:ORY21187.1 P-loop containing nucleoside triphosphate hydrolase protein [Neocallimastix californiae]